MRRLAKLRTAFLALGTVVVIAAAAWVWHSLPTKMQIWAPFDVRGAAGAKVSGRAIAATVHGARIAPKVTTFVGISSRLITAAGNWVAVDTTLEAVQESVVPRAELMVAGNIYRPTDRFILEKFSLVDPGIRQRGAWVFDVAPALLNANSPLVLRVWVGDGRLDSRLVIAIAQQDVTRDDLIELSRPRLSA